MEYDVKSAKNVDLKIDLYYYNNEWKSKLLNSLDKNTISFSYLFLKKKTVERDVRMRNSFLLTNYATDEFQ